MKFGDPHFPLEGFQNLSKNIPMTFKNFPKTSKKIQKLPKDSSKTCQTLKNFQRPCKNLLRKKRLIPDGVWRPPSFPWGLPPNTRMKCNLPRLQLLYKTEDSNIFVWTRNKSESGSLMKLNQTLKPFSVFGYLLSQVRMRRFYLSASPNETAKQMFAISAWLVRHSFHQIQTT